MIRRSIVTAAVVLMMPWLLQSAVAQDTTFWKIYGGVGYMHVDGRSESQTESQAGLPVVETTDIEDGRMFILRLERRFTQSLGLSVGGLGWSDHVFVLHQRFPDGTEFESRDSFTLRALSLGVVAHFFEDQIAHLALELFLMYAWYDELTLAGAGPPLDDTEPRVIRPDSRPGIGVFAGLEIPLRPSWLTLRPWAGVAIAQFTETLFLDSRLEGLTGSIDVRLTPVMGGASLGVRF